MKRQRATSHATRLLSAEAETGKITQEEKDALRALIIEGDPAAEEALDQATKGNAVPLKHLAANSRNLRSRLQQLSNDGLLSLRHSLGSMSEKVDNFDSNIGEIVGPTTSRNSDTNRALYGLNAGDSFDLEALLWEVVTTDADTGGGAKTSVPTIDDLSSNLGDHLYFDPNLRNSFAGNSLDMGFGTEAEYDSVARDVMGAPAAINAWQSGVANDEEEESPRKRTASECSSQRSMISDATSESVAIPRSGETVGNASLLLAQARARESTARPDGVFSGGFKIIDNYFTGNKNEDRDASSLRNEIDGGGKNELGANDEMPLPRMSNGANIATIVGSDLDAIEHGILSAFDEDSVDFVEDSDMNFEGLFDFAGVPGDVTAEGTNEGKKPENESSDSSLKTRQRGRGRRIVTDRKSRPEQKKASGRKNGKKMGRGSSTVFASSGVVSGSSFSAGSSGSNWPFRLVRTASVNEKVPSMTASTWHSGPQTTASSSTPIVMPIGVHMNNMSFMTPQSMPSPGHFGFQQMFQNGIPLHGSAPQSGGNFKAPVGINASWHAGMGMIPQQFSMMQGSKAIVRNSEGANKDNNMRGSESSNGGDPGRAQRIASLSDRADVLQENGYLTPHQRGLVQIIFRRGDDYLCSRFNEAMTEAESGSTANLMELLRMAERLRELPASTGTSVTPGKKATASGSNTEVSFDGPMAKNEYMSSLSSGVNEFSSSRLERFSIEELNRNKNLLVAAVQSSKTQAVELRNSKQFDLALKKMKEMKEQEAQLAAHEEELGRRKSQNNDNIRTQK